VRQSSGGLKDHFELIQRLRRSVYRTSVSHGWTAHTAMASYQGTMSGGINGQSAVADWTAGEARRSTQGLRSCGGGTKGGRRGTCSRLGLWRLRVIVGLAALCAGLT
jgi:hypothetical protein